MNTSNKFPAFATIGWITISAACAMSILNSQLVQASAGDWGSFNYDARNSSSTPLKGRIGSPAYKWRTYPNIQPTLWTGLTFSRDQGLTLMPLGHDQIIRLNPLDGVVAGVVAPPLSANDAGTGEGIPIHADLDGDGIPELIAPYDGFGIVVTRADGSILWQKRLLSETGIGRLDMNVVVGDVNGDGFKEVLVHDDGRALRILRCLSGLTGDELWAFNNHPSWIQGVTSQNFDVWFDLENDGTPELLFQEQTSVNGIPGVVLRCIRTQPSKKTVSWLNNWPSPYSQRPLRPWSQVSGNPIVGEYHIEFVASDAVSVNGIGSILVRKGDAEQNTNVVPGLNLVFGPEAAVGDRVDITVHNSVDVAWERTFATGYCFAHFLLADFNNDGEDEICFGTTAAYYCIKKNGDVLWTYATGLPAGPPWEDLSYGGAFADLDNDGGKEIIFNAWDELVCLNGQTGAKKWSVYATGGTVSMEV